MTDGVFRFSRHPMYLGMALISLGAAIALGALSPFVVSVGFAALLHFEFVIPEEAAMLDQYGDQYTPYMSNVRQWI